MKRVKLDENHFQKMKKYGLSTDELQGCIGLKFEPGETVLQSGMTISNLLVVVNGKVKVCAATSNGKSLVLRYYVSEGLLGDIELMLNMTEADSSIVAITEFECVAIPYRNNIAKLKANNTFLNKLAGELSVKLIESSENRVSAALYTGEERLCTYILQAAHNDIFNDTLTDTAASVGMSYRHMFRILNQLCDSGILEKKKSGYHIMDRKLLKEKQTLKNYKNIQIRNCRVKML